MAILQWQPNQPEELQLKYASGKHVTNNYGREEVMFSLQDGRLMYVPLIVEKQIQALQVRPGQTIEVCKHQSDGRTEWKVRRIEAAQPAPQPKPAARAAANGASSKAVSSNHSSSSQSRSSQSNGHAQPAAELIDQTENLDGPDLESFAERHLEQALRISLMAAKKAEEYGQKIGKPIQFDKNDVRAMAATLLINGRGRAA